MKREENTEAQKAPTEVHPAEPNPEKWQTDIQGPMVAENHKSETAQANKGINLKGEDVANEVLNEFDSVTSELLQLLEQFSQEQISTVPFEGSWTAGQVAEHLRKSYGLRQVLHGPVTATERDPAQKIEQLKADFLNFTVKLKSPEFILPDNTTYNKEALLHSLKSARAEIREAIETLDLSQTCLGFALPGLGELTRLEIIHLFTIHSGIFIS